MQGSWPPAWGEAQRATWAIKHIDQGRARLRSYTGTQQGGGVTSEHENFGPTLSQHRRAARTSTRPRLSGDSHASSRESRTPPTSEITARSALQASATTRMRILAASMMALTLVGIAITHLCPGDPLAKRLSTFAMLVLFSAFGAGWIRSGRMDVSEGTPTLFLAIPICLAGVIANLAFGLMSPFCIALAIAILLFASSTEWTFAITTFVTITAGYLGCALLVRFGVYTRPALFPSALPAAWMWDVGVSIVMLLYGVAFLVGRLIRRDQYAGVQNFERALREASMRDALLHEARDALKRSAGIGAPGRFTEQTLDGYKLGAVIGRGGMGEVYAAERVEDGREAAVKLLRLDAMVERAALLRFEREARIVTAIRSPHVVEVLGVSNASSVLPYIAMERLQGIDLASYLRECGRMPLLEVLDLVTQAAAGLSAAHAANVVHRDLKPNNVFRSRSGGHVTWKLLDFGVSKWMDSSEATLTAAELVGTPHYMAPEQARGEHNLDGRADVYALSAIAYRALTGEAPFAGHMPRLLRSIAEDMPKAPSQLVELPRQIDYVLAIGLAKDKRRRFQSPFELSAAFSMATVGNLSAQLVQRAKALLDESPYKVEHAQGS